MSNFVICIIRNTVIFPFVKVVAMPIYLYVHPTIDVKLISWRKIIYHIKFSIKFLNEFKQLREPKSLMPINALSIYKFKSTVFLKWILILKGEL